MILAKAEAAVVAYLKTRQLDIDDAQIAAGQSTVDKEFAQLVVCSCIKATEDPPFTGNYFVDLDVMVKTVEPEETEDNPEELHRALVGAVELALKQSDLAASLTAAELSGVFEGFTCFHVQEIGRAFETDDDSFVAIFRNRLYCCPSDIS